MENKTQNISTRRAPKEHWLDKLRKRWEFCRASRVPDVYENNDEKHNDERTEQNLKFILPYQHFAVVPERVGARGTKYRKNMLHGRSIVFSGLQHTKVPERNTKETMLDLEETFAGSKLGTSAGGEIVGFYPETSERGKSALDFNPPPCTPSSLHRVPSRISSPRRWVEKANLRGKVPFETDEGILSKEVCTRYLMKAIPIRNLEVLPDICQKPQNKTLKALNTTTNKTYCNQVMSARSNQSVTYASPVSKNSPLMPIPKISLLLDKDVKVLDKITPRSYMETKIENYLNGNQDKDDSIEKNEKPKVVTSDREVLGVTCFKMMPPGGVTYEQ